MPTVHDVCEFLEQFAPPHLAEEWDNVGLLVGDRERVVSRVMTCLTVTPSSAAEAVAQQAELIVTHHPFPFRPLKRLTTDSTVGRLLLDLIRAGIAVFSPHTAFDSAAAGINQQLAEGMGLSNIGPLVRSESDPSGLGSGRVGQLAGGSLLLDFASRIKSLLSLDRLQVVGSTHRRVQNVAVACGSAGQFLETAQQAGCDTFVTGETNFHTCLQADATGVAMLLLGHYASERFAVEQLASILASQFPNFAVWASRNESDPLKWV